MACAAIDRSRRAFYCGSCHPPAAGGGKLSWWRGIIS
jgi:hypothetical protein